MTHHEDQAASVVSIDPLLFQEKFDELAADLAPLFTRREPRAHALDYLRGLVADLPRKNCWTLAEHAGHARAFGLQRLLYQPRSFTCARPREGVGWAVRFPMVRSSV